MLQDAELFNENPLRSTHQFKWFRDKNSNHAPREYLQTVEDKAVEKELERLFEIFDSDGSGQIELDEISLMFETAGLIIDVKILKKIFL